jgi:hypothetical protein
MPSSGSPPAPKQAGCKQYPGLPGDFFAQKKRQDEQDKNQPGWINQGGQQFRQK